MSIETKQRGPRMTADERREEILDAAMVEFSRSGLEGTSTERIAQRAGVSQPYLFRLFGTKRDLFLAAVTRCFNRVEDAFRLAAEQAEGDKLKAMGEAYKIFLSRQEELLLQLQSYAACSDPEVRLVVQSKFAALFRTVQSLSGESEDVVRSFFSCGMLMTVAAATGLLDQLITESWLREMLGREC